MQASAEEYTNPVQLNDQYTTQLWTNGWNGSYTNAQEEQSCLTQDSKIITTESKKKRDSKLHEEQQHEKC